MFDILRHLGESYDLTNIDWALAVRPATTIEQTSIIFLHTDDHSGGYMENLSWPCLDNLYVHCPRSLEFSLIDERKYGRFCTGSLLIQSNYVKGNATLLQERQKRATQIFNDGPIPPSSSIRETWRISITMLLVRYISGDPFALDCLKNRYPEIWLRIHGIWCEEGGANFKIFEKKNSELSFILKEANFQMSEEKKRNFAKNILQSIGGLDLSKKINLMKPEWKKHPVIWATDSETRHTSPKIKHTLIRKSIDGQERELSLPSPSSSSPLNERHLENFADWMIPYK